MIQVEKLKKSRGDWNIPNPGGLKGGVGEHRRVPLIPKNSRASRIQELATAKKIEREKSEMGEEEAMEKQRTRKDSAVDEEAKHGKRDESGVGEEADKAQQRIRMKNVLFEEAANRLGKDANKKQQRKGEKSLVVKDAPGANQRKRKESGVDEEAAKSKQSKMEDSGVGENALCKDCISSTMHSCNLCGLRRCRMYHLGTFDDGVSFVCSVCSPTIKGILGFGKCRPPTQKELEDYERQIGQQKVDREVKKGNQDTEKIDNAEEKQRKKAAKRKRIQEDIFGFSDHSSDSESNMAGTPQRKNQNTEHTTPRTPQQEMTKALMMMIEQKVEGMITPKKGKSSFGLHQLNLCEDDSIKDVSVEDRNEYDQAENTPKDLVQCQLEDPGFEDVTFYLVHVKNGKVVWICQPGGESEYDGDAKTLYVQPDPMLTVDERAIMFRIMKHTSLKVLMRYVMKMWRNQLEEPMLTFESKEVNMSMSTADFADSAALMVQSRNGDKLQVQHTGLLWTCTECETGKSRWHELSKAHKETHPKGIQMLNKFDKMIQPKSWGGHPKYRNGKVQMCPLPDAKPFTFGQIIRQKQVSILPEMEGDLVKLSEGNIFPQKEKEST